MTDTSRDGPSDRLRERIVEVTNEQLRNLGIYAGDDESLRRTRRNFAKLDRDAQAEEDHNQDRRKTIMETAGNLVTYIISTAIGGVITWFFVTFRGH